MNTLATGAAIAFKGECHRKLIASPTRIASILSVYTPPTAVSGHQGKVVPRVSTSGFSQFLFPERLEQLKGLPHLQIAAS
jgi:hypothetical protein